MAKIVLSFILLLATAIVPQLNLPREITVKGIVMDSATAKDHDIPPFETDAQALTVYDTKDDAPVIEYEKDVVWPIASLTKMMSAIVFFEQQPNLKKKVALEKDDMIGGGMIKVPAGTTVSADDLIHATLMVSANNTAHALYKATGLSQEEFVGKMNERARELGLTQTHFTDPSGLDPNNISTPEEYSQVMNAAMDIPEVKKIMTKRSYTMRPTGKKSFPIGNTNKFLGKDNEFTVMGAKTGLLNESGFNLAVQAEKDGKEVTAVVFGETSFENAFNSAQKLLDKAFEGPDKE